MKAFELNIDGLVGPNHHYAGLSHDNVASLANALTLANPAEAALQGLAKMRLMYNLGLKQAIYPPQPRPDLFMLDRVGFPGTPAEQVRKAKKTAPILLYASYSSSGMWTANTATVSASADTQDHRVHFTPSNMVHELHRHQEARFAKRVLKTIFHDERYFQHHKVLPETTILSDEGAANHARLCVSHDQPGLNVFVYGKEAFLQAERDLPGRQTLEASRTIARNHRLNPDTVLFAHQNPSVIQQGVFHNDVIAVANESVLLLHEEAWLDQPNFLKQLKKKAGFPLIIIEAKSRQLTVPEAVSTYLFNSQLVTLPSGKMALIAPAECRENKKTHAFIQDILLDSENPIDEVHYLDLRQSMRNGGGPACLRLRVVLNEAELASMHQGVLITDALLAKLETWVKKHYRDRLHPNDLDDPDLITECYTALDALTEILGLGTIYPFQMESS